MAAMMYNPACYCLLNGTVCIQPLKEENYQPPEHLKSFIPESMKEVWGMVIQASRCIHKVIGAMEWLTGLKCAPDIILHFGDSYYPVWITRWIMSMVEAGMV